MSIYDREGYELNNCYDITSKELDSAYNKSGDLVWSNTDIDYSKYSYVQKWGSKGIGSTQGFDIYDDKIFWCSKLGNASVDNAMYIFNLSDGSNVLSSAYITAYGGHANNVTFSNERFEDTDLIPLVMMSTAYRNSPVYINRIDNNYKATIVRKYTIPVIADVTNMDFDICYGETNDIAYVVSVFGSNSDPSLGTHIGIAKFDMTKLTENSDGTFTPKFVSSVSSEWHYWKQGIKYHDGLIWLASGYPNFWAFVYGIDPNTGEVKFTIDCETKTEIEGAVWYPDKSARGGYALYVGFAGMMLRKYTFS